jgi:hypothetical protein
VRVLWKSDGTRKGTRPVGIPKAQWIGNFAATGGRMYFDTRHRGTRTLWETAEGLRGATAVHATDMTGLLSQGPGPAVGPIGGGRAVFGGGDAQHGWELWSLAPDPVTGDPEAPDLVVSVDGIRTRRPYPGGPAVVSLRVRNAGTAPATGTAGVRVWLTPGDGDAEAPNTAALQLRLAPGRARRFNVSVTLPAELPPRLHESGWPANYFVAAEIDPDNRIAESLEGNNTGASVRPSAVYPLVSPGIRLPARGGQLRLARGAGGTVLFSVVNGGVNVARGRAVVRATVHGPGIPIAGREVGRVEQDVAIRAGGAVRLRGPITVPEDLQPGDYSLRLTLVADPSWDDMYGDDNQQSVPLLVS